MYKALSARSLGLNKYGKISKAEVLTLISVKNKIL